MENVFSSKNYSGSIVIAELVWSVFLYLISHKRLLSSEYQQQLWLSCARMHFSQAVSNGAIEQLDRLLCTSPVVNPYSLHETHGKLNNILFGFLETLFLSFIPRQLNSSEVGIIIIMFVESIVDYVIYLFFYMICIAHHFKSIVREYYEEYSSYPSTHLVDVSRNVSLER